MTTAPVPPDTALEHSPDSRGGHGGLWQPPRWPAWTAPAALLSGLIGAILLAAVVGFVVAIAGGNPLSGGLLIASTVIQNLALLGAAIGFAWITARPRPQDFGLRVTRLWPAVGWAAAGLGGFVVVMVGLSLALGVQESPTRQMLDQLGVGSGAAGFVVVALLICVVAPLMEELFFRGFFFSALRSRMNVWWAAILGGLAFGSLHILNFLVGIPVEAAVAGTVSLTVFGFLLCLVYWRTGSLYPCIGAHALNNTFAFVVTAQVSVLAGLAVAAGTAVVLTGTLLAVQRLRPRT